MEGIPSGFDNAYRWQRVGCGGSCGVLNASVVREYLVFFVAYIAYVVLCFHRLDVLSRALSQGSEIREGGRRLWISILVFVVRLPFVVYTVV